MAVRLSPETEQRISQMVASGDYDDADSMLGQALTLLAEHERMLHLRKLVAVGAEDVARGDTIVFSEDVREQLWQSALNRAAAGESPSPDVCP